MIKKDYYAPNRRKECQNYGLTCYQCSHWGGTMCDMIKKTFTTSSSDIDLNINMARNNGYYLQSDPKVMELLYLEYDGERAPENIQFIYSQSNIHDLEKLINLLNKKNDQLHLVMKDIEVLDAIIAMLDRRNKRQARHLEKIYKLIENKEWDKLTALFIDTHQDYEEII